MHASGKSIQVTIRMEEKEGRKEGQGPPNARGAAGPGGGEERTERWDVNTGSIKVLDGANKTYK